MNASSTRLATAFACTCLMACGGGGGEAAPPPGPPPVATAEAALFPLPDNLLRVYALDGPAEAQVEESLGRQTVAPDVLGTLVRTRDVGTGAERRTVYVVHPGGVRQYAVAGADAVERALDGTELMRWPAVAGDRYVQVDATIEADDDADGDGRKDRLAVKAEVTAVALGIANTPAGNFATVFQHRQHLQVTRLPSGGGAPTVVERETETWYAPAHGPVRRVITDRQAGVTRITTAALTGFRLGPRGFDGDVPYVIGFQPQGFANANAQLSLRFNEPVAAESVLPGTFTVTDLQGAPVAGRVELLPSELRFHPVRPWADGMHFVRLEGGFRDLVGNPQSQAYTNSFVIDARAPGVVGTSPRDGEINVRLTGALSVNVGEPPAPASVNADNVRLSLAGVPVAITLRAEGHGIVIEPVGGLQRGRRYTLQVSGITDAAGNTMVQSHVLSFDTTPARYAEAQRLVSGFASDLAQAVADVTGDGAPDLVYPAKPMQLPPSEAELIVQQGVGGGAFGEPRRSGLGPTQGPCFFSAVVVGDLTAEGRPDVVVGSLGCGVRVLQQAPDGAFEPVQQFNTPVDVLRLADLDGDGQPELLGAGMNAAGVQVWRQAAGAPLLPLPAIDLNGSPVRDLRVADLDGDGRADLVLALGVQGSRQQVAILRQLPGGGFSAPALLSAGIEAAANGVAVGDLNADGRLDIVATVGGNANAGVAVFFQAADGSFGPVTALATLDLPSTVEVVDIDNDGRMDIVISHSAYLHVGVYLQRPGGFGPEELYFAPQASGGPQGLVVADVDRDGFLDIVTGGYLLRHAPP
jgi:Bacterial Ig-like domain/FG-GAP-like repeat